MVAYKSLKKGIVQLGNSKRVAVAYGSDRKKSVDCNGQLSPQKEDLPSASNRATPERSVRVYWTCVMIKSRIWR